ncbi:hypothetical protein OEZ85_005213 [Tetradesmus obliquus]|uniref:Uncharacterized protein n=1 Tax=Tetradesmus obliquus TaxID=3088 RepID=A0ABY8UHL5_TETOB|nr:hypothetical protein OEZ85_005213 [Tetradesmus obliquus]
MAYSTTVNGCWNGYTHAHETGHNQGCQHNYETTPQSGFKNGWRKCQSGSPAFKTIMSYPCSGEHTNEIGVFSNPNIYMPVLGSTERMGDPVTAHCARAISESAAAVASFRPSGGGPLSGVMLLRSFRRNRMCSDENGRVVCNSTEIWIKERFFMETLGPNSIAVRGGRLGQYCSDDVDRVICNRDQRRPGPWETFTVVPAGANRMFLRGGRANKFCVDDGAKIVCNRDAVTASDVFGFEYIA